MAKIPTTEEMLKAGVHFGHQAAHWHPKMAPFIFGERQGIHIIDLDKTREMLAAAADFLKGVAARGGKILFVGTKRQAQESVKAAAEACNMPYVTGRWLGGTITNFPQIKRSIKELKDLKDKRDKGELRKYTKKEQVMIGRQIEEMTEKLGGIAALEHVPEAVLVFDVRHEKTAVEEAAGMGVKIVALCDSNVNPEPVDYVIPGNDDSVKSIALVADVAREAVLEGLADAASATGGSASGGKAAVERKPAAA